MVHTPGGVRCDSCAQLRRPPMYELAWRHYLLASLASFGSAVPLGLLGALLLPPRTVASIFYLAFALLLGVGGAAVVSAAMERATGGKRGTAMRLTAAAGVVAAVALRLLFSGDLDLFNRDVGAAVAAVAGVVYAWGRLR